MTKEILLTELGEYRKMVSRLQYLKVQLERLESAAAVDDDAGIAGAQLGSSTLTGMPGSHYPRSAVERVVLMREKASATLSSAEQRSAEEINLLTDRIKRLDILLDSLQEDERMIVIGHAIDRKRWESLAYEYAQDYADLSISRLKQKYDIALRYMVSVANGD
ncbi:MAG: hypothetical protein IJ719_08300 [Clostridia bacterium]|nr:hypothetical protein [Clostridia bacterium]